MLTDAQHRAIQHAHADLAELRATRGLIERAITTGEYHVLTDDQRFTLATANRSIDDCRTQIATIDRQLPTASYDDYCNLTVARAGLLLTIADLQRVVATMQRAPLPERRVPPWRSLDDVRHVRDRYRRHLDLLAVRYDPKFAESAFTRRVIRRHQARLKARLLARAARELWRIYHRHHDGHPACPYCASEVLPY